MRQFRIRLLKIALITLLIIFSLLGIFIFLTGPQLPPQTEEIITEVMNSEIPEFVKGKTGYVKSEGIKIWYESISPKDSTRGSILLFMGITNNALVWPQKYINALVDSGYQVIRYDYRGTGMSDWLENWEEKPYSLLDLAKDAKVILDTLQIKKAHLVGISLGGMVAQEFAIHFPENTISLVPIMSSANILDPNMPSISKSIVLSLVKVGIKYGMFPSDESVIKLQIAARALLKGTADYQINIKNTAQQVLYDIRKRKGYNFKSSAQHQQAVILSGSRYEKLKLLKNPTLVIHGLNDPFIPIEHSKKLASLIPGAKTKWIQNMAHDLPIVTIDSVVNELYTFYNSDEVLHYQK